MRGSKKSKYFNFSSCFDIFQNFVIFPPPKKMENMWFFSIMLSHFSEFTADKWERNRVAAAEGRRHRVFVGRPKAALSFFASKFWEMIQNHWEKTHVFHIFNLLENDNILENVKNWMKIGVFWCFATPHLIGHAVRIRCGAAVCLEDAYIPFSEGF